MQNDRKEGRRKFYYLFFVNIVIIITMLLIFHIFRGNGEEIAYSQDDLILSRNIIDDNSKVNFSIEQGSYIDDTYAGTERCIETPQFSVQRGIYTVAIEYETLNGTGISEVCSTEKKTWHDIYCDKIQLNKAENFITYNFYSNCNNKNLTIHNQIPSDAEGDYLLVRNIKISPYIPSGIAYFIVSFMMIILSDGLILFVVGEKKYISKRMWAGLFIIMFISSYPLFTDYMIYGHDLSFHLMRIEGIKDGLMHGMFPVKIQPTWYEGNGYAAGVMYGDIFLYFPALLRMMGISVSQAYKTYVFFINILTVLISFYTFTNITGNQRLGFLGCTLYTLSMYRLADVYTRAAVGEYTAMAFYPLVLCGLYFVYKKGQPQRAVPLLFFGITGIIQSHVLSCEIMAVFVIIVCLILWKETFKKAVLIAFAKTGVILLLINLFFIIPFGDYLYSMPLKVKESVENSGYIQGRGITLAKLISLNNGTPDGVNEVYLIKIACTIGISFLTVLFLYLWGYLGKDKLYHDNESKICICFSGAALFLSTVYFPYDWLAEKLDIFKKVFGSIQFPWRFLAIGVLLLSWLACIVVQQIKKADYAKFILYMICFIAIVQGLFCVEEILSTITKNRIYDGVVLDTSATHGKEYLLSGTDDLLLLNTPVGNEGAVIIKYKNAYGKIDLIVENEKEEGFVEVPLLYYKGYTAFDSNGTKYPVKPGRNNQVRVDINQGKVELYVRFSEPILWRCAEIISFFSFIVMFILVLVVRNPLRKRVKCE